MTTDTSVTKADYAPVSTTERKSITKKRTRTYQPIALEIHPYRKKPKMTSSEFLSLDDPMSQLLGGPKIYCFILELTPFT